MSGTRGAGRSASISPAELTALVDRWARYVRSRVRACDVDDVLQSVRETVLRRISDYDPSVGEPGAWVFGVVRVTVGAFRRMTAIEYVRQGVEVDDTVRAAGSGAGDPLAFLIENRDVIEWARLVAEAATAFEWRVVVAFAKTEGTSAEVAVELGTQPSTVRAARARVAALARTALVAIDNRDEGLPITLERCVPCDGGYSDVLPYRTADETLAAEALGISRVAFRTRRAMLRRLEGLVHEVQQTAIGARPGVAAHGSDRHRTDTATRTH